MTAYILIVEDDHDFADTIQTVLRKISSSLIITIACSRDSAIDLLENKFYDLVVLDLKIPVSDGLLETNSQHGFAVFTKAQAFVRGTPIFVLTGSSADDFISYVADGARQVDIWGEGKEVKTIDFLPKHKFDQFPGKIRPTLLAIDSLSDVELDVIDVNLSIADDRLIRIFSKRVGATNAQVSALSGGLSGAKVLRVRATDAQGARVHDAVAKLGTLADVKDEVNRYDNFVSRLESRVTPRKLVTLETGAGSQAGVFYDVAASFNETGFQAAFGSSAHVIAALSGIKTGTSRWREGVPPSRRSVGDIRRRLISDEKLALFYPHYELEWIAEFESKQVTVRWCCVHGDLHGENILVAADGNMVLIDYGDVGEATACLDPLTLEFSLLFHTKGACYRKPGESSGWPSAEQAADWGNLTEYVKGCPVETFVHSCRKWSNEVAAGQREVAVTAYSYLVRQLKYENTNKELIFSLLMGVKKLYSTT